MKYIGPLMAAGALAALAATAAAETAPGDVQIVEMEVAQSLTGQPGDPAKGRAAISGRRLGNCLACHEVSAMKDELFHGNVGPSLDGAGSRWTEAQLRAIVVNSKAVFGEAAVMPAFYRADGFTRPGEKFIGKTILTAQEVEDVVAYLLTLKE